MHFRQQRFERLENMGASSYILLLPKTLDDHSAQHLCPEPVRYTALLRIDMAPDHGPSAPLPLTGRLFSQARLPDTRLAHQDHTLRMLRFKRDSSNTRRLLPTHRAYVPELFGSNQQLP